MKAIWKMALVMCTIEQPEMLVPYPLGWIVVEQKCPQDRNRYGHGTLVISSSSVDPVYRG